MNYYWIAAKIHRELLGLENKTGITGLKQCHWWCCNQNNNNNFNALSFELGVYFYRAFVHSALQTIFALRGNSFI